MRKESWNFENETGQTAFLAGVVDCLSDYLSCICDWDIAFDADIFYIKYNDYTLLNDEIKKRLYQYHKYIGGYWDPVAEKLISDITTQDIDRLDFKLESVNTDIKEYLCKIFSKYSSSSSSEDISAKIEGFLSDLNWHLGKPICVYETSEDTFKKNLYVLGQMYLYIAFDYFFIAYDEYVVLFIFGTVE